MTFTSLLHLFMTHFSHLQTESASVSLVKSFEIPGERYLPASIPLRAPLPASQSGTFPLPSLLLPVSKP